MQAAVLTGARRLESSELPEPPAPGRGKRWSRYAGRHLRH